jgi:hypothetical protein
MGMTLSREFVHLGQPLACDLLNTDGLVVFRKGFVVTTPASLDMMLNMDLYPRVDAAAPPAAPVAQRSKTITLPRFPRIDTEKGLTPLRRIDALADDIYDCCTRMCDASGPALKKIASLVTEARRLYAEHGAACIAAIHFHHTKPASCLHPLYSLFLVELLAPAGDGGENRMRVAGAALTANLGMHEYHDQWANQLGPLNEEQKQQVRNHPERSVQRLKTAGINDPLWFAIVRQHHERLDGSGYPQGLSGDRVLNEALLLGLIDRYLSFVMPRANRKWVHPTTALKTIYGDVRAYGERNVNTFIKRIGVYPPGTSVRLANGEVAVVTRHQVGRSAQPTVVSVGTGANHFYSCAIPRDTALPEFAVKSLYVPDLEVESNPALMVSSWL